MTGTSLRLRMLVWAMALHLAHAPIPVWDGNDTAGMAGTIVSVAEPESERHRGPLRWFTSPLWDVDILLLGIDPPADADSGPLDDPRHPRGPAPVGLYYAVRPATTPMMLACWQPGDGAASVAITGQPALAAPVTAPWCDSPVPAAIVGGWRQTSGVSRT